MGISELTIANEEELIASHCANFLGCNFSQLPINYFGLPLSSRPLKKGDYLPIVQKFHHRLPSWTAKLLFFSRK
jgi:hypothetical protein